MTNTNESGRSRVEMLGVLAIIGVLSVMGIAGYTQAMKKYKANEILNTASMLSVMAKAGNGGTGKAIAWSQSGLTAPVNGVEISADENGNVTITGVEANAGEGVCDMIDAAKGSTYSVACS